MVDLRSPLNARQVDVLRWINDGCPDGVMHGHTYKTVALALQNRRLATVSKKGGVWRAELTDAGRHYLHHGTYPPGHAARAKPAKTAKHDPPPRPAPAMVTPSATPATAIAPSSREELAEQLVKQLLAAGGVLEIDTREDRTDYEALVRAAKRAPSLPYGKQLRMRQKGWWGPLREIYLDEDFAVRVEERPVPVPDRVSRYHAAVAHYRSDPDRHEVSKDSLGRASRILHALATEAERRGHTVKPTDHQQSRYLTEARATLTDGQLSIVVNGFRYNLRIREMGGGGGERLPPRYGRKPLPLWQESKLNRFVPTGRLSVTIERGYSRDRRIAEFRDTRSKPLDEKLPAVLRELEIRALEDEFSRQQAERQAAEKRRRWEQAMERAKHDLREARRADILHEQVRQWHTAIELDHYLDEVRKVVDAMTDEQQRQAAEEWLSWATTYRATIDPLQQRLALPPDEEPTPEALRPYLDGWNPYGPDRHL
ncbi:MAG: hypothetical protein ACOC9R_01820 [bacterium]